MLPRAISDHYGFRLAFLCSWNSSREKRIRRYRSVITFNPRAHAPLRAAQSRIRVAEVPLLSDPDRPAFTRYFVTGPTTFFRRSYTPDGGGPITRACTIRVHVTAAFHPRPGNTRLTSQHPSDGNGKRNIQRMLNFTKNKKKSTVNSSIICTRENLRLQMKDVVTSVMKIVQANKLLYMKVFNMHKFINNVTSSFHVGD